MTDMTEASVLVDRPTEVVWSFLTSERFAKSTNPDVIAWKQTSAGSYGVGTTFQEIRSKTPKVMDFRVTEYEPNRKLSLEITSGPIKGTVVTERIEEAGGKTKFTETMVPNFSGFYKLLGPFFDRLTGSKVKRETETRVGNLKRTLESEPRP
jgi:uncharacterized protein YndB with AHSA1/START domain